MRNHEHGAVAAAHHVDAVGDDLQRIDVQTGVGFVEDRKRWFEHRHLEDLVALLLAAREPFVHGTIQQVLIEMDQSFLNRSVNEGFSGGEKKRNEIFQMAVLDPKLAVLDETDSGLDIDALKVVAAGVNAMRSSDRAIIVVTHYQRLLNYIVPDFVHVLSDGRIVRSGGKELALELEAKGYGWLEQEAVARA